MDVTIRPVAEGDAEPLAAAIAESVRELGPWMPWALAEGDRVAAQRAFLAGAREDEVAGRDRVRVIVVDGAVAGSCGLHPRIGDGGLEIGYWVRTSLTGRGVARRAVALLCAEAFADPAIDRVEIRHDADNVASGAVARASGFTRVGERRRETTSSWRLTRAQYRNVI